MRPQLATLILTLFFSPFVMADYLRVHIYPSPHGINWKSPKKLARSTLKNFITLKDRKFKNPIGHVAVEILCEGSGTHIYRGATAHDKSEQRNLILKEKFGMGVLFHNFLGYLQKEEDLQPKLDTRIAKGRNSFIHYKINEETCERLVDYAYEYEELGMHLNYGLFNDPRKGEGAGCSAFAWSFIRIAGLDNEEYGKYWSKNIRVPMKLVGGPITGRKVPYIKAYFYRKSWAKIEDLHLPLFFWDPDLMHNWVKKVYRNDGVSDNLVFEKAKLGKSKGLVIDMTDVPTPDEPFFDL